MVLFFLYYVVTLLPYWPRYYFICYNVVTLLPVVPLFLCYLSLRCYVIASGARKEMGAKKEMGKREDLMQN